MYKDKLSLEIHCRVCRHHFNGRVTHPGRLLIIIFPLINNEGGRLRSISKASVRVFFKSSYD